MSHITKISNKIISDKKKRREKQRKTERKGKKGLKQPFLSRNIGIFSLLLSE
nr:MAG TPA: hypothetical protein [Caudoviricetes sp.]